MRFLIAISTKKQTRVIGHEGKSKLQFLVMISAILRETLKIVNKEDILNCLEVADNLNKKAYNSKINTEYEDEVKERIK